MSAKTTTVPIGLLCLVLLLSLPASGLNCNLLKLQQQRFNQRAVELLEGMEGKLPPECLRKMPAFSFPIKILEIRQPRAATKAVLDILHGFLLLMRDDHLWVAWKATLRKRFLHKLYAQAERVQRCLGEKTTLGQSKEEWMQKLELKKYFRSFGNFLEEKGLDKCTQEFARHEMQVDFIYMDRLTERMKI